MATTHISEEPLKAVIKGGLLFGDDTDYLADGDLTSLAAAKAAVDTDNDAGHVSQRTWGNRIKGSLDLIDNFDSTYLTGSDVDKATMLAISNGGRGRATRY